MNFISTFKILKSFSILKKFVVKININIIYDLKIIKQFQSVYVLHPMISTNV